MGFLGLFPVHHWSTKSGCLQAALHTLQGQSTVASMEQAWSEPATFVLEAMSHIPAVLRRSLAKQVFLQPFYKVTLTAGLLLCVKPCVISLKVTPVLPRLAQVVGLLAGQGL